MMKKQSFAVSVLALLAALGISQNALAQQTTPNTVPAAQSLTLYPATQSPYGDYLTANFAANIGDFDIAAEHYAKVAQETGNATYQQDGFKLALASGRMDLARTLDPKSAATDPAVVRFSALFQAVDALKSNRAGDAEKSVSKLLLLEPDETGARLLQPVIMAKRGQSFKQDDDYQTLAKDSPLLAAFIRFSAARAAEARGDQKSAETLYLSVFADDDGYYSIFGHDYGLFLERRGQKDAALLIYQKNATKGDLQALGDVKRVTSPNYKKPAKPTWNEVAGHALADAAILAHFQKDDQSALLYNQLSTHIDPTADDRLILKGQLLDSANNTRLAHTAWQMVPKDNYAYAQARLSLAHSYRADKLDDQYESEVVALYGDYPDQVYVALEMASLHLKRNEAQKAVDVIESFRASHDEALMPTTGLMILAQAYDELDKWPEAEALALKALKASPDDFSVLNFLGYGLINREIDVKRGMGYIRQALKIEPRSGAIIDSLGWGYFKQGENTQALMFIEQAIVLEPADSEILEHLGDVYWAAGRKIEAKYAWERALREKPKTKVVERVKSKLLTAEKN